MPEMFYLNQSDYIAKLNTLASKSVLTFVSATVGGTTTLDCSTGGNFYVTLGAGNTTIAFSNIPSIPGFRINLYVQKDNSATQRTITWPGNVRWPGATIPTLTPSANIVDVFEFKSIDFGTTFFGKIYGLNYGYYSGTKIYSNP